MLAIGGRYRALLEKGLSCYVNAPVLWLPDNPNVDSRLAGHADLSMFVGTNVLVVARGIYPYIVNKLTHHGYDVIASSAQSTEYPRDAGLCICRTGRYTVYNPKTVDPLTLDYLDPERIAVNQGYARCSVCVVSENAIITSDHGIATVAAKAGLDVLEITPGHIILDGFDYGFIGGASFKVSPTELAFTGILDHHPDKAAILDFMKKYGVAPVYLTNNPIFDVGGAVLLP